MKQIHQTLELPASVQGRACFAQFIGGLAVDQAYFEQAISQIEKIGMQAIWEANEKNPAGLFNPSILGLAGELATKGVEIALPKAEDGSKVVDENGIPPYVITKGTAVIPVNGPLSKQSSSLNSLFGGSNTVGMRKALALAMGDSRVERVMFHIDSPGGTVAGTGDLGDDILQASAKKPIASYIEDMGTSAAYWIASQTAQVYASKYANVGSIGVIWTVYDRSEMAAKQGVKVHAITSSPGKAFYVDGMPISKQQLEKMQSHVDALYAHFIGAVAQGRGVSEKEARAMGGDAAVYDAHAALEKGLIDSVGSFAAALADFQENGSKMLRENIVQPALVSALGPKATPTGGGVTISAAIESHGTGAANDPALFIGDSEAESGGSGSNTRTDIVLTEETPVSPEPNPAGKDKAADPVTLTGEQHAALEAKAAKGEQAFQMVQALKEEQSKAAASALAARRDRLVADYPTITAAAVAKCATSEALDALEEVARAGSNKRTGADPAKPEGKADATDYSQVPDAWAAAPGVTA